MGNCTISIVEQWIRSGFLGSFQCSLVFFCYSASELPTLLLADIVCTAPELFQRIAAFQWFALGDAKIVNSLDASTNRVNPHLIHRILFFFLWGYDWDTYLIMRIFLFLLSLLHHLCKKKILEPQEASVRGYSCCSFNKVQFSPSS